MHAGQGRGVPFSLGKVPEDVAVGVERVGAAIEEGMHR